MDDQSVLSAPAFLGLSHAKALLYLAATGRPVETNNADNLRVLDGLVAVGFVWKDSGEYSYACDKSAECAEAEQKFCEWLRGESEDTMIEVADDDWESKPAAFKYSASDLHVRRQEFYQYSIQRKDDALQRTLRISTWTLPLAVVSTAILLLLPPEWFGRTQMVARLVLAITLVLGFFGAGSHDWVGWRLLRRICGALQFSVPLWLKLVLAWLVYLTCVPLGFMFVLGYAEELGVPTILAALLLAVVYIAPLIMVLREGWRWFRDKRKR
jgi:hypothetical protein